jgi:ATP-dependent DNA helicase RecG
LSDAKNFREHYLVPSIELGLVEMAFPDKPRSSKQRYHLTRAGRAALARQAT